MAANAAWPRDSWPATPTSRVSPTAPTIVAITKRPSWSQKSSSTRGRATATRRRTSPAIRRGRSDTERLLAAEQPLGAHQQDDDHHEVGHDLAETAAEESEVALVAHGQRGDQADDQSAEDRSRHRVEAPQHPGRD